MTAKRELESIAEALTPPFLLAALLLCLAGAAKLRSPAGAARALEALGLPARPAWVRVLGAGELALGVLGAVAPGRVAAGALACLYGLFAAVAIALARRRAVCGCFGENEAPASPAQAILSSAFALVGLAAAVIAPAHGLGWVLGRPPVSVVALMIGLAGSAYGAAIVYTELPPAWSAWRQA